MARRRLKRYLGVVFIGVVIVPAVVLSFLAIRAISHEEAYIEKQIEGTLSAEVTHVAAVLRSELDGIENELAGTLAIPDGDDPSRSFDEWRRATGLVDIPFLLSPTYEILWPAAAPEPAALPEVSDAVEEEVSEPLEAEEKEKVTTFLETQQAFLSDEERTPVYENIAVAYKDEILESPPTDAGDIAGIVSTTTRSLAGSGVESDYGAGDVLEEEEIDSDYRAGEVLKDEIDSDYAADDAPGEAKTEERTRTLSLQAAGPAADADTASTKDKQDSWSYHAPTQAPSTRTRSADPSSYQLERQSAISRFTQSEEIRKKVYEKASLEGQEVIYRNIAPADRDEVAGEAEVEDLTAGADMKQPPPTGSLEAPVTSREVTEAETEIATETAAVRPSAGATERVPETRPVESQPDDAAARVRTAAPAPEATREPPARGRLRSIFISEPLSFSEIVAGGERGIVPRIVDGSLQLLYWQRSEGGGVVGCLVDPDEVRERIVGALPGIYSTVRILTVLDELGRPVIVPPGHEGRDWRRPFVAEEISEMLPRWEIAAYLTDPDIISSRAQVARSVLWILILILFVSIVGGGVLVVRSTYAEMRLAQQKTSFVANVSHELKTPLTSIRMFAEMLRDGRQPDRDKQREYLDIMTAETERLTRLVNNVLDFARMERGEKRYTMKTVDLAALASGVVESQRARLEHNGFEVSFATRTGPLEVKADDEAIKQTLLNLLSNAEKYSAETKQIEVSVSRDNGSAVIGVSDRGVGIPEAEAGMIFEEFYRVDDTLTSKVKGAGLGLTIARRILRDHGGDIRFSHREGGGSTFEILLPLTGEKT